ncbi:hypothetical protein [Bacteroides pyogenes]|uniref:hypothetical protein n=1 Tax=Bacteroides pyogenes TaxID=310300 RepID=UPI0024B2069B|nr:hypothetical protein [Bacteroides pyogenes]
MFALMHMMSGFSVSGLLTYTGASVVVGVLYKLIGGLLFSAIMHVTVNSLTIVFIYHVDKLQKRYGEKGET